MILYEHGKPCLMKVCLTSLFMNTHIAPSWVIMCSNAMSKSPIYPI